MSSSSPKKVVLVATEPYSSRHEPLLLALIERHIELFCAAGIDCGNWETAMDLLLTDPERAINHHITTTSHPDEPLDDVLNMAELWSVEGRTDVEVIRV